MPQKLALLGGKPEIRKQITPFRGIGDEEAAAVRRVMEFGILSGFRGSASPDFFGGEEVQNFEQEWRTKFGVNHAISLNSGTSGLIAALAALGVTRGDEVILPPYTMSATAMAVLTQGAIPVFVDVEPQYFCLDVDATTAAITSSTKAIIAVNLFGHPAQLAKLKKLASSKGIGLIEDNAQAFLASEGKNLCGTVGDIGVFSLNVHKHIQTGEGGICVTNDSNLAARLNAIRNHGENAIEYLNLSCSENLIGLNFRMTEISASIGRKQLEKSDRLVERCRKIAENLTDGLSDLPGIIPPAVRKNCRHSYFMWSVKYQAEIVGPSRDRFCQALVAEGIPVEQGYVAPLYELPIFSHGAKSHGMKIARSEGREVVERLYRQELFQFQPVAWDADPEQIEMIISAIRKVYNCAEDLM